MSSRTRFGIAEWYGRLFVGLTPAERREFASNLQANVSERTPRPCPFKPDPGALCSKPSGVCSIRAYVEHQDGSGGRTVSVATGEAGSIRATCPNRFHDQKAVYAWAGELLLKNSNPKIVPEVGFLEPIPKAGRQRKREVGRIDLVLMNEKDAAGQVDWAALEIQAVYFSGKGMADDFVDIAQSNEPLPFPVHVRRPDYRSSGPKRLLPQLQTKVPTLSRWGKRMAVVVDAAFFDALDTMQTVEDLSSADIAWLVVRFEENADGLTASLKPYEVHLTTLIEAVGGLTGGKPSTQDAFLVRLTEKAARNAPLDLADDELGGDPLV